MKRRTFIKTILLSSSAVMACPQALFSAPVEDKSVKIIMLYNNVGSSKEFLCEWGLSIWVEDQHTAVMFDTGQTPSMLWNNMKKLNIDFRKLSKIIISHHHVDHSGGLGIVLKNTDHSPEVLVPKDELKAFQAQYANAHITGVGEPVRITEKIWSTGSLGGFIQEQSMILIHDNEMIVMTGCAHPGIIEIVQKAKTIVPDKDIRLVMGGFHLNQFSEETVIHISDRLKKSGVKKLAPSHCTGTTAISIFKREWQEAFIDFGVGDGMTI